MKRPFVLFGLCAALFLPAPARAQSRPLIEFRTAIGASNYLHGDWDFVAPTALVSVRIGIGNVAIEPEVAVAFHSRKREFQDFRESQRIRFEALGVNVVRRWPGRISPFAGGGIGVFTEREHNQTSSPLFGTRTTDRTSGPRGGVQGFAGVDVRIRPHLSVFGQGRYELRSLQDPGGGSVMQAFAGVALALR